MARGGIGPCPLPRCCRPSRPHPTAHSRQPPGIRIFTFEAFSGFTRVTARWIANRPRRPLSRGSSPVRCPTKPLVSYRSNRQLSGWNPPPLVIRAVGAHWEIRASVTGPVLSIPRDRDPAAGVLLLSAVGARPLPDGVG